MVSVVFGEVFTKVFPYIAPLVFVISAFAVADQFIDLIRKAINGGGKQSRRSG
ncbi:hypothetical protein ACIQ57_24530 [Lysinibacillus xylanilyticus]|uniref:hypothetical protein n=1 Tax=Lysinibacillus xylanilyticus TaxID=582475 RepID=UPI0037FD3878